MHDLIFRQDPLVGCALPVADSTKPRVLPTNVTVHSAPTAAPTLFIEYLFIEYYLFISPTAAPTSFIVRNKFCEFVPLICRRTSTQTLDFNVFPNKGM